MRITNQSILKRGLAVIALTSAALGITGCKLPEPVGIELNISREDLMTDTSKTQSPAEVYLVDSKGNRIKLVNRPLSTLPKEDYLFAPNFDIAVITNQQGEERRYTFDELRKEYQISLNNAYLANRGKNTMPKQKWENQQKEF